LSLDAERHDGDGRKDVLPVPPPKRWSGTVSIFGDIWNKIVGHSDAAPSPVASAPTQPSPSAEAASAPQTSSATSAPTPLRQVDVEAILVTMATAKGRPSNWRTSIVDLLTLLDLDSSLTARKELAQELNIHAGADGSAEQNIALHKAVMQKLEENGGKVPDSLKG
jgi:Domain of unknown function (DUF3597)